MSKQYIYAFDGHKDWLIEGLEHLTTRTRTFGDYLFVSKADIHSWGTDQVFVIKNENGKFKFINEICNDDNRAVMPAYAVGPNGYIYVAMRRFGAQGCWIDVYGAPDIKSPWQHLSMVGVTGGSNGNPPALAYTNNRLYCAFANPCMAAL